MLYKTVTKANFRKLVEGFMQDNEVFGPIRRELDPQGNKIYRFLKLNDFEELQMDDTRIYASPKNFFLPFKETLATYNFVDTEWEQEIHYPVHPRVIIGMRACDINALRKLDEVMLKSGYPNPYYTARRRNTVIIGLDHEPLEDCFCRSVGADVVFKGFDLFLTDIGDKYFVAIGSDTGYRMIDTFGGEETTEADQDAYKTVKKQIESKFKTYEVAAPYELTAFEGVSAVEAPRGILYHYYQVGDDGIIERADCVIPTGQNHANIQYDLEALVAQMSDAGEPEEETSRKAQMLIRAHDPCISCSVH